MTTNKLVFYSDSETDESSNQDSDVEKLIPAMDRKRKAESPRRSNEESRDSCSSSSDDGDERFKGSSQEKKRPLSIPNDVLSMFEDAVKSEESDIDNHKGKMRSFPHEEGNWASYVFIPAKISQNQSLLIKSLFDKAKKRLSKLELVGKSSLHITLSQTVSLRHYWIEPLVDQLKDVLLHVQGFRCHLDIVELYTNEEKTRSFLGLRVILGEEKLKEITDKIDLVFDRFGLPKYYQNPSFHISFAWHLGDITRTVDSSLTRELQDLLDSFEVDCSADENHMTFRTINAESIYFKTGNKVYCIKR